MIAESYFDEKGNPVQNKNGYSIVRYKYDDRYNVIEESYYDTLNNPVLLDRGYASIRYEYDEYGNRISSSYYDEAGKAATPFGYFAEKSSYTLFSKQKTSDKFYSIDGKLIERFGRYETKYEYNSNKQLMCETYFDDKENIMNRTDLFYAKKEIIYNSDGYKVGEKYKDSNDHLVITPLGYASYTIERNQDNLIVGEKYFDEAGEMLGEVVEDYHKENEKPFRFLHCSDGLLFIENGTIEMFTDKYNNSFNAIRFQLVDAKSETYLSCIPAEL